jgi:hypothetical protein
MSKITIDDLVYEDLIFIVEKKNSKCDIPVHVAVVANISNVVVNNS